LEIDVSTTIIAFLGAIVPFHNKSEASQSFSFNEKPEVVATTCQEELGRIGKLKQVNRETGTITGSLRVGGLSYTRAELLIKINGENEGTTVQVAVQLSADSNGDGAGKAIAKFAEALTTNSNLQGKSKSGW